MKKWQKILVIVLVGGLLVSGAMMFLNRRKYNSDVVYYHSGNSNGYSQMRSYVELTVRDGKALVRYPESSDMFSETVIEKEVSLQIVSEMNDLLKKYRIYRWDGYQKSNPYVMDGSSWNLNIRLANGQTITASGYMMYPDNYREFINEQAALFAKYLKE